MGIKAASKGKDARRRKGQRRAGDRADVSRGFNAAVGCSEGLLSRDGGGEGDETGSWAEVLRI